MDRDLLLAIETSGRVGSVALTGGDRLVEVRKLSADRRHTAELLPTIRDLLADHGHRLVDVGVFAYSRGPGSFTGLRVAATIGRMMHSAIGCRVVAVPTLEVIARNALPHIQPPGHVVALLDARRGDFYGAVFEIFASDQASVGKRIELKQVVEAGVYAPPTLLARIDPPLWLVGEGISRHREACAASGGTILDESCWQPSAAHVAMIGIRMAAAGEFCAPHDIVPHYLRPPECEEVYEQRRAEARERRGEVENGE